MAPMVRMNVGVPPGFTERPCVCRAHEWGAKNTLATTDEPNSAKAPASNPGPIHAPNASPFDRTWNVENPDRFKDVFAMRVEPNALPIVPSTTLPLWNISLRADIVYNTGRVIPFHDLSEYFYRAARVPKQTTPPGAYVPNYSNAC